jgi:hypothetical protein
MDEISISLDEALRICLPKMTNERKALDAVVEILEDYINSDNFDISSNIVKSLTGKGDFDDFSINIHEFHGIFWISAPEFYNDGYFTSKEDAISFAQERYEPFITNYFNGDNY